jgi:hypothetical protein
MRHRKLLKSGSHELRQNFGPQRLSRLHQLPVRNQRVVSVAEQPIDRLPFHVGLEGARHGIDGANQRVAEVDRFLRGRDRLWRSWLPPIEAVRDLTRAAVALPDENDAAWKVLEACGISRGGSSKQ